MDNQLDISDEKQVDKSTKKWERQRDQERDDLRFILSKATGRRYLLKLITYCKVFETISHHEPLSMSRLSGGRDIGLWVLDEINAADKSGYMKMISEMKDG